MLDMRFGKRADPPCSDCDDKGYCTMNCGPRIEVPAAAVAKGAVTRFKEVRTKEEIEVAEDVYLRLHLLGLESLQNLRASVAERIRLLRCQATKARSGEPQ